MTPFKEFMKILTVPGVEQFILVDQGGHLIAQNIKDPDKAARWVLACGQNSSAIGRTRFKYLLISRKSRKKNFIFPVGNYYLGVVKEIGITDIDLVNHVTMFLNRLQKKINVPDIKGGDS